MFLKILEKNTLITGGGGVRQVAWNGFSEPPPPFRVTPCNLVTPMLPKVTTTWPSMSTRGEIFTKHTHFPH